jgi:hypothetical protein
MEPPVLAVRKIEKFVSVATDGRRALLGSERVGFAIEQLALGI